MNALDYVRMIATAKRNFFDSLTHPNAKAKAIVYNEIVELINEVEDVLPFENEVKVEPVK